MYRTRYGEWALIIGGSEGVGAEIAHALAADGVNCFLIARKPEPLERLALEIGAAHGVDVRTISMDVAEHGAAARIKQSTAGIPVGMLVCNAGAGAAPASYVGQSWQDIDRTIQVNVNLPAELAWHFGSEMAARGRGALLFLGSGAGECGTAHMAAYSAAKAFQRTLAEALWFEMKPKGVDVLALVLGITRTPQLGRMGYPIDDPAVPGMDSREAALAGLAHLEDGPVLHLGEALEEHETVRALPRREAVELMGERALAIMAQAQAD